MALLVIPERLRGAHDSGMQRFLLTGQRQVLDKRIQLPAVRRRGQEFTVELTISEIHSSGRRLFCAFMQDITQRVASEERLRASEERLRLVTDNLPVCISYVGADLRFQFANQAHDEWLGRSPDWILGRHLSEVLGPEQFADIETAVGGVLEGRTIELERDFDLPGGGIRHAQGMYIPDLRDGQVRGFYAMWHDVSVHRKLAQVLEQRALLDELTGLPNRAAWNRHLVHATAQAERAGTGLAVLFMDLDGFKQVNDNHGHDAGDAVLREFAEVLKRTFRRNDFVARLGGDEFVVLLDQVSDAERDVPSIARKLHDAVAGGLMIEGTTLPMQPSIGAAIQHAGALNAETILRCADEAMYEAKRAQGARFVLVNC